jgi:hypothetical protein
MFHYLPSESWVFTMNRVRGPEYVPTLLQGDACADDHQPTGVSQHHGLRVLRAATADIG